MIHAEEWHLGEQKTLMRILIVILEKATKDCGENGQWFKDPQSNRVWTNYTLCAAKVMTW